MTCRIPCDMLKCPEDYDFLLTETQAYTYTCTLARRGKKSPLNVFLVWECNLSIMLHSISQMVYKYCVLYSNLGDMVELCWNRVEKFKIDDLHKQTEFDGQPYSVYRVFECLAFFMRMIVLFFNQFAPWLCFQRFSGLSFTVFVLFGPRGSDAGDANCHGEFLFLTK